MAWRHSVTASCLFARRHATTLARRDPSGEWAMRASVLGNEGALSGHVFLDPKGRAAYMADGVQIVGRGVGHWAMHGDTVAVELDVYQYAAAAADIPAKPHRFRGIWNTSREPNAVARGDWYFCPEDNDGPRLVGAVDVAPSTMELSPGLLANTKNSSQPNIVSSMRDQAMAALDAQPHLRAVSTSMRPDKLEPFKIGKKPMVYYIPNWVTREQEAEFIASADGAKAWEHMKTRSSQEWGAGDRCACGRGLARMPLPPEHQRLAGALHQLGVFDGALYPMNSVRINAYKPGQGIFPHCDGPVYYPKVGILSMGSPCLFHFYSRSGTEDTMKWDSEHDVPAGFQKERSRPQLSVFLEPRSLLVFSHDAFWHHRHGIDDVASETITENIANLEHARAAGHQLGDTIPRRRRVSLTMRHLLPRCACQG